jgi:hypothetical protein
VTDGAALDSAGSATPDDAQYHLAASAAVAALAGVALAWSARAGAVELLIAIAVLQGLFAFAWVFALRLPGRRGALVIAALAAGFADTAVSVWPHGRLGVLLAVFGLAMPVLFVHQLMRGAARLRVLESLGGIAVMVVAVVALPALVQLRHEFTIDDRGADVTFGVAVMVAGALVVGYLIDLTITAPRFDADVPRGLLGVIGSAAVGAVLGQLTLRNVTDFAQGRAAFVGAGLGALVALFGVAAAFLERGAPPAGPGFGRRGRPLVAVLLPVCLIAPIAFLLCLAVRS